ncbi:MAG: hypothetical protein HY292_20205 [Planctomycetes bacterium]|nr:hypothetical protein [Planctomycetota bacterium]
MTRFHYTIRRLVAVALFVVAVAGARASAQCLPDNLNGACCQRADVQLPSFPAISQEIRYLCFDNCQSRVNGRLCVDVAAPRLATTGNGRVVCGLYLIRFTIHTCSPNRPQTLWSGSMRAQYSRTWLEAPVTGGASSLQVHRFLLNGDLTPSAFLVSHFGSNRFAVPPCAAAFSQHVHFWGYIDYARDCGSPAPTVEIAWALNHDCDAFEHAGGSSRPSPGSGPFHGGVSYGFVGPGPGFVVDTATLAPAAGANGAESVRRNDWTRLPSICVNEEPLQQASMSVIREACACSSNTGLPAQYVESALDVTGTCGSAFHTDAVGLGAFVQKRIGGWTNAAVFPGAESLLFGQGPLETTDACAPGILVPRYYKGVETIGGFDAFTIGVPIQGPLGRQFADVASANVSPNNPTTIIGAPYVSFYVLNVNFP